MENLDLLESFIENLAENHQEEEFEVSVALPQPSKGVPIGATNIAVALTSLANELQKLNYTKVKGMRVRDDKLVVTLEGPDPRPKRLTIEKQKTKLKR